MKVFIVGAGAVASVISNFLAKDGEISKVICGSNDLKRAKEFINTRFKKISLKKVDASSIENLVKATKGFDLVINASLPRFNLNVMQACLKVKANYQDLASELADLKTAEQLSFHKKFKKAGLVALINSGIAPGVSNLLAREADDVLDEIDTIDFRLVEEQKASELIFTWSIETTLDELTAQPLNFRNNKFILTRPFSGAEEYDFPHPIGKKKVFSIYGDEVSTLPFYIKTKNITFKSSGTDIDFSKALHRLGLFEKKPVNVNGLWISPVEFFSKIAPKIPTPKEMIKMAKSGIIENAYFSLVVEAVGKEKGKHVKIKNSAIFPDMKAIFKKLPGANYISYPIGLAAYSFLKVLPKIKTFGVLPPEALDEKIRNQILLELENNGIIVNEEFSVIK
ncbi:MAG: hypothetical protein COU40_03850 [Candidatus Moranbacteria bacterium CG10_big_fil_rev_8_21_14_0_10_35_21]|nr:MAG: hypothetical protein COU40_03850 [Candidatus Moranbacteria bacterium CG10_big_fil_rev_8_21_14_0_10_35_21]PJA88406.1 MAG: hypothetical protein CO139_03215 [Candidatus Moranbacteria bacterium CG_4_9_14_3_um_filter_36_9]